MRTRAALVLAAMGCSLAALLALPAPPEAAAASSCSADEVLLLIDQSASLKETDRDGARVLAAQALIDTLGSAPVPVHLTIAGFGNEVRVHSSHDLGNGDVAAVAAARNAVKEVGARDSDQNTDYVDALRFSADYFGKVDGTNIECRTMVWFTDGAYDIDAESPAIPKYTSTTKFDAIEGELDGQVCGPKPAGSRLTQPLSEQIRNNNFAVSFIDLQGAVTKERTRTTPTMERLLTKDGPCKVSGEWLQASDTSELYAKFFTQGQATIGRTKLEDCSLLTAGVPISAVKSVAVLGSQPSSQVLINGPSGPLASGSPAGFYSPTDADRASAGLLSVAVTNGVPASCFLETDISIHLASRTQIYGRAEKATIAVFVTGTGMDGLPEAALGEDLVSVELLVNDRRFDVRWDANTRQFQATVPGPFTEDLKLDVSGVFKPTNEVVKPLTDVTITVSKEPAMPKAVWTGDVLLENKGAIPGSVVVSAGIDAPGELCVTFEGAEPIVSPTGEAIGSFEIGTTEQCGPLSEPLTFDAVADFPKSINATGSTTLRYSATYQAPGASETASLQPAGELTIVGFQEVKSASTAKGVLFALLVAGVVGLLSYLLLFITARWQGRLPDPSRLVVGSATLATTDGIGRRTLTGQGAFGTADLRAPRGDRSKFVVGPFTLRKAWPWNPLAELHAIVECSDGQMVATPAQSSPSRRGRRQRIPHHFTELAAVNVKDGAAQMHLIRRSGSTADDYQRQMDLAISRTDAAVRSLLDASATTQPARETDVTPSTRPASLPGHDIAPQPSQDAPPAATERRTPAPPPRPTGPPPRPGSSPTNGSSGFKPPEAPRRNK